MLPLSKYSHQATLALFERLIDLETETVLITPNKRLSRFIQEAYAKFQQQKGRRAWPSLPCYSIEAWLQHLWERYSARPSTDGAPMWLLNTAQEQNLWQKVIKSHASTPDLLNFDATAKLAMDAWRLMHQWQLKNTQGGDLDLEGLIVEQGLFEAWSQAFAEQCQALSCLTRAEMPGVLTSALGRGVIDAGSMPRSLIRVGFDEISPQWQSLFDAMSALGSVIDDFDLNNPACGDSNGDHNGGNDDSVQTHVQRYEFPDFQHEVEASAVWAQAILESHPEACIAVVVPTLMQQRGMIERAYQRLFDRTLIFPDEPQRATGFNMSAGQVLADMPLIAAAQMALSFNRDKIDIELASKCLLSPFLGVSDELDQRAALDVRVRKRHRQIRIVDWIKQGEALGQQQVLTSDDVDDPSSLFLNDWLSRLTTLENVLAKHNDPGAAITGDLVGLHKAYPSQWAHRFCDQLHCWGWPGDRRLDTLEYQQYQRWQACLEQLASLDSILGAINSRGALKALSGILQGERFQAQTQSSPLQILGVLEAAGLPFDYLWVMNLDDETWPPSPNPNPLLSLQLQVERQVPQASYERECLYAKRLTQRFIQSAPYVVFSSAQSHREAILSPSPMIAHISKSDFTISSRVATGEASESLSNVVYQSRELERSYDDCGPQMSVNDTVYGGTQIIKDQAACAFRAFAKHRLRGQEIPVLDPGLSAMDRGVLVHHVMELIWRRLRTQKKLLSLGDEALSELIDETIEQALQVIREEKRLGERSIQIEQQRLRRQIGEWMTLEKQRQPFKVLFNEGRRKIRLKRLPLTLRYDRVDQLEDGRLMVIDYKTAEYKLSDWFSDRPEEPQIPLYCVANPTKVSAAAFGNITAKKAELLGLAEDDAVDPALLTPDQLRLSITGEARTGKVRTEETRTRETRNGNSGEEIELHWDAILDHWKVVMEQLAQDFVAGMAEVKPKSANACRYCDLQPLCRIKETLTDDD